MGILRSEPMKHGTLVLPVDRARFFVNLIGANASMQFEDMNARDMHRPYKKHIQRIDEMERILRFLMDELTRLPGSHVISNNLQNFLNNDEAYKLDEVEVKLKKMYQTFRQFKDNNVKIIERRNAALEERYVVSTAKGSFLQSDRDRENARRRQRRQMFTGDPSESSVSRGLLDDEEGADRRVLETMFSNVAGVIPQAEQERFARALFRATRGNTYTHFQSIPDPLQDPKTGKEVRKSVFVIYFQDHRIGTSASAMNEKVTKLCGTFGVNTYRWPSCREAAEEQLAELCRQVDDHERLLKAHDTYVQNEAATMLEPARAGGNSLIEEWRLFCMKEKSIYATLNLFEGNMNLRASCWYPASEEDHIRAMLIRQSSQQQGHSSAMLVSDRTMPRRRPPTYIRRNEFTNVFQTLVDEFHVPRYGEANPMLFTIVTFPFLFGVMYGDIGHGGLLFLAGLWAVQNAPSLKYTLPELYNARYIILMMGFFGMYAGFIYNDFFSIGLNLFGSRWKAGPSHGGTTVYEPLYDIRNEGGAGPYPFGIDPAWHGAQNELMFMNSLKMKCSVIIGVAQMLVGLVLRFSNAIHEQNMLDFCCECIPMMVFMLCFFGFMDYMILYKWVTPMDNAPSIINSLIAMGMWQDDPNPMFGIGLVRVLMTLCILMVPIMLLPKPLLLLARQKAKEKSYMAGMMSLVDEENQGSGSADGHDEEGHFDFGEIFIHQVIETIEYVLGTVSHCASYLRLWALSLAHQQLSLVFFERTILTGMEVSFPMNAFAIFLMFGFWFVITVGILMGMDVMECFLHTLRLHWVEFQSKFYRADGYAFVPYRHMTILEDRGE